MRLLVYSSDGGCANVFDQSRNVLRDQTRGQMLPGQLRERDISPINATSAAPVAAAISSDFTGSAFT